MTQLPESNSSEDSVRAAIEGGDDFSALFEESRRVFWLVAAGILGNRSLADDVVQEAALIAIRKWDQFKSGTNFGAWMGQIVRHIAMNTARKEYRRNANSLSHEQAGDIADRSGDLACSDAAPFGPAGQLSANQTVFDDRMIQALSEVKDIPRACLLLRIVEGLEYSDISSILNIPEGTAMSHVHRTRRFLRQKLGGARPDVIVDLKVQP